MLPGLGLTAGGGMQLGLTTSSRAESGPITVGGLTFAPAGKTSQWVMLAGVAVAAVVLVMVLKKGRG